MKTKHEIAEENGLEIIETTTGMNGYPQSLEHAIVGFETFEDAQKIADLNDLEIEVFKKKDGWQLWQRQNCTEYEAFQNSSEDYGDNYSEVHKISEEDFFEQEVKPRLESFDNLEELKSFLENQEEIWEEVDSMADDEIVITNYGRYYDTIKKESMRWSHDTWTYEIGLI